MNVVAKPLVPDVPCGVCVGANFGPAFGLTGPENEMEG